MPYIRREAALAQGLRGFPKDATVGEVEFAPTTFQEKMQAPHRRILALASGPFLGELGLIGKIAQQDQRLNQVFDKVGDYWKVFGSRKGD
jgi:hypothetical protein